MTELFGQNPVTHSSCAPAENAIQQDPVREAMQTLHSEMDLVSASPVVCEGERPLALRVAAAKAGFETITAAESVQAANPPTFVDQGWFQEQRALNIATKPTFVPVPERNQLASRPYIEPSRRGRISGRATRLPTSRKHVLQCEKCGSSVEAGRCQQCGQTYCEACYWMLSSEICGNPECPAKDRTCRACAEQPCVCG